MSSGESANIFDGASEIIRARLSSYKDVDKVIDHLKQEAQAKDRNPLTNRRLILEPVMLSQRLRVPRATVEAVVEELQTFNLVHVWVRATCPSVDPEDDNVIVETDDNSVFRLEIAKGCGHCGQIHGDLGWANIETFYAIHLDGQQGRFDIRRLFRRRPRIAQEPDADETLNESLISRISTGVLGFFGQRARKPNSTTPTDVVAQQLNFNQPNSAIPTANDLTITLLTFIACWIVGTLIIFLICRYCCDAITTSIVLLILFIGGAFGAYMALKALYAGSAVPRMILASAYIVAGVLYTTSLVDFDASWTEGKPITASVASGRIDPVLACCATVVIVGSHLCVVLYHRLR